MNMVKVARLGTAVQEVALANGARVSDALDAADLGIENEEIRINGGAATTESLVNNGDIVTLVPKVKGGQKIVKVARLGTAVQEVAVSDTATVASVLEAAGIEIDNEDVRVDGNSASMDSTSLNHGSVVTIVPKVKGGK